MDIADAAHATEHAELWSQFSSEERRLAYHAKLWTPTTRLFAVPLELMHRWRAALPEAVERQNADIDEGGVSRRFTLNEVLPASGPAIDASGRQSGVVSPLIDVVERSVVGR